MDAKNTLAKLPLTGSLFLLILGVACFLGLSHDQKIRAAAYAYHASHLVQIEAALFEDFYSKRLAIEQSGSSETLAQFRQARQNKKLSTISDIILSDRSFRTYVTDNTHLLFTSKEAERWQMHSTILNNQLQRMASKRFALIPEEFATTPQLSRLLSYLFIERSVLNLLSNLVLMLCMFILLEPFIQRATLWAALFCLSIAHGSLYLLFANPLSLPLAGANILVYFLFSLALTRHLLLYIQAKSAVQLYAVLTLFFFWTLKTGLDIYYQFIFPAQCVGILMAIAAGAGFAWKGNLWHQKANSPEKSSAAFDTQPAVSADVRKRYNEALTALTRFNFLYARSSLRQLHTEAPGITQIMESSYHLEKLHPEEEYFWSLTEARINHAIQHQLYPDLLTIFKDIQQCAQDQPAARPNINPKYYHQMMIAFLNNHNLDKAEQAFKLLELSGDKPVIKDACLLLIDHFSGKRLLAKQADYQALLASL